MGANYATAVAARAAGAVERGWLPEELPDSAFDIAESHHLDTNVGSGSFRFQAVDAEAFRAKLQPASPAEIQRFDDAEKLQRKGYGFYGVSKFIVAVNWQTLHVHFKLPYQAR